ncbi:Unconventional myosin-XIX [Armadillidium nasatum]|uniref:Unconventional myosin-XIX n=1 Tax=Armadillidium nasatum TaxID=96803 RepID=A0A5N5SJR0_9CRUS|nr:Unconventional myosin-XIX [Armadillidium nasatum]
MPKMQEPKNERPTSLYFVPEENLIACDDLTALPYLYDETVLECITARYFTNTIYTWAGPILVAVNPFKSINGLYSDQKISKVFTLLKEGHDHQDPHVFTVAGLAHKRLTSEIGLVNQAILVSGESGAGKTESARFLLTYLTQVEDDSSCITDTSVLHRPEDIKNKILASNPILEAFGNAATLRNHNSSRFGKLIRLQYSQNVLKGASLDTYLLEKTRVTSQPSQERNFHIFYQLLSGIINGYVEGIEVDEEISFNIMPGLDNRDFKQDLLYFKETQKAFRKIGIPNNIEKDIYRVVAAIMFLGNISFQPSSDSESWTFSTNEVSQKSLARACHLLRVTKETLQNTFTKKKISVSLGKETSVIYKYFEREDQCEERRDALMQFLYISLFNYLVDAINSKICDNSSSHYSYLGILDIYGFEAFDENSLEQLCINYTNERLHHEFTRRYIASEHKVLIEEGFMDIPFVYVDNTICIKALDSPISVFSILNEECQLKRVLNEDDACLRVCNALQNTGVVTPAVSRRNSGFLIKHYAGNVSYNSSGLLHKNKDDLPLDVISVLTESSCEFISSFSTRSRKEEIERNENQGRKSVRKITTLSKFKSSLDSLINILGYCDLHYVRCLKPNSRNTAGNPDKSFLLEQLKSNGILETVKISQAGYPVRMLYMDFVKRYSFQRKQDFNEKEITYVILAELYGVDENGHPPEQKCRFGKTRIFLSESCLHQLEEHRSYQRNIAATCIQKNIRMYLRRKWYKNVRDSVMVLQSAFRFWLTRQRFLKIRSSTVCIQKNVRTYLMRKKYQKILLSVLHTLQNKRKIDESFCPGSRISLASSCYGSLYPTSITDFSASEAEIALYEDGQPIGRNVLETEESGIETDTESLSGQWHRSGRTSRHKTKIIRKGRKEFHDVPDFSVEQSLRKRNSPKYSHSFNLKILCPQFQEKFLSHSQIRLNIPQFGHDSLNIPFSLDKVKVMLKDFSLYKEFEIPISSNDTLFYRDGIISYRHLRRAKIKFHIKSTCLPYSTSIPYYDKPQGVFDILRV